MLETIGVASLDALIDEAIPASIRLQAPLEPAAAGERAPVPAAADAHRASQQDVPLVHRPRLSRHDHAERHPAHGDGEPGLVHALHAVSGRDRAGPARVAPQLPDDGDGADGDGGGERLAAGRSDGGGRGDDAAAPGRDEEGRRHGERALFLVSDRVLAADDRGAADAGRAARASTCRSGRSIAMPFDARAYRRAAAVSGRERARRRICAPFIAARTTRACWWPSAPTCWRWRSSRRRARWAPTSSSATRSVLACRSDTAGRTPRSSPRGTPYVRQMPGRIIGVSVDVARAHGVSDGAGHARAAHPSREGDVEHLHRAGAARQHGGDVCRLSRARGAAGDRLARAPDGAARRAVADADRPRAAQRALFRYACASTCRPAWKP